MAELALTIDPSGAALVLTNRTAGWRLTGFDAPTPSLDSQWASSADTEGALLANSHPTNRIITVTLVIERSTDALLQDQENLLSVKIGKLEREGGELQMTVPSGDVITFTVLQATLNRGWDREYVHAHLAAYEIVFTCLPYGLGTEVELGTDTVETTLPYLVKTVTGPAGDVPALGRLLIDNDQAVDQWWLTWGLQSRYYSSSANALLFYEAEGRTALSGAATAVGPSGASGGGSNVVQHTSLQTVPQAILSTQATGGGAHLSHIGTFRVYARVQVPTANAGNVSVWLEWAQGDFVRVATNPATTIPEVHEGRWRYVDLGLVTLGQVVSGTQRWEGRVVAKSTVADDDINIDYLILIPATEGSGVASGVFQLPSASPFVARDVFAGAAALNGLTATTGGTWATSGDADDLTSATGIVIRSAVSDTPNTGRNAALGSSTYAGIALQIDFKWTANVDGTVSALRPRYVDSSNFLQLRASNSVTSGEVDFVLEKKIAGSNTVLDRYDHVTITPNQFYTMQVIVTVSGDAIARLYVQGETWPIVTLGGTDSTLGTGGTLDDGKVAFYDEQNNASAVTRTYANFVAYAVPADAAVFASQSIEIRHDTVVREDSGGSLWVGPSSYGGDYLLIPPAGAEGRSTRVIVKAARNDPLVLDSSIDDISARLFATPRYFNVPT